MSGFSKKKSYWKEKTRSLLMIAYQHFLRAEVIKMTFLEPKNGATLAYKAEAVELQKRLRHLQSEFDVLTAHGSTLVQGRRARVSASSTLNGHLTTLDDSLSARNLQFWKGQLQQHKIWLFIILEKGPCQVVAEERKSECSRASLDDASNILVRDVENSRHQRVAELRWLRLMKKHVELVGELSNLYLTEKKLLSETIPALCWELAQLQDTYILQGDYDLKVMRQEFYISRQKVLIAHLINHLARRQFLNIACQLEKKNLLGAYSLLKVIESELQDTQLDCQHTYVSAPRIVPQISSLHSDLMTLQSDLKNSLAQDIKCINELCTLIQSLQQLLFPSSTTAQPILAPRRWPSSHYYHYALMKEQDEIKKINAKLSAAVEEATLEHCKKSEIIKHHSQEVSLQRRFFVDFVCNPERLRSQNHRCKTGRAEADFSDHYRLLNTETTTMTTSVVHYWFGEDGT
ncbi:hypothetical protein WN943_011476 [Citrus x changshan-huyou]